MCTAAKVAEVNGVAHDGCGDYAQGIAGALNAVQPLYRSLHDTSRSLSRFLGLPCDTASGCMCGGGIVPVLQTSRVLDSMPACKLNIDQVQAHTHDCITLIEAQLVIFDYPGEFWAGGMVQVSRA